MKYIGKNYPIQDARAKVTGSAIYAGEIRRPGMLHAKVVLSEVPHGRILSIDKTKALALPGVVAIFTCDDLFKDSMGSAPFDSARLVPNQKGSVADEPILVREPCSVGDRVAAVVAETAEIAEKAASLVKVTYDPLPVIPGIREVMDHHLESHGSHSVLHENRKGASLSIVNEHGCCSATPDHENDTGIFTVKDTDKKISDGETLDGLSAIDALLPEESLVDTALFDIVTDNSGNPVENPMNDGQSGDGGELSSERTAQDDEKDILFRAKIDKLDSESEQLMEVVTAVSTQRIHHAAMENHGCVAEYDPASGKLTIWTACQSVFGVRTVVADLLKMKYTNVRVIKSTMGGSFGGKQEALIEPLTAFLARALCRPVSLQLDRVQSILSTMTRPATISRIKTAVSSQGRLSSCEMEIKLDCGAYISSSLGYVRSIGSKIFRIYRVPHVTQSAKAYRTHTLKAGGARGWGSPEFCTAMEIHMDRVAKALKMDRVALRMKNLVKPGDWEPIHDVSLGSSDVGLCLQKGAEAFGWAQKLERRTSDKTTAVATHHPGSFPHEKENNGAHALLSQKASHHLHGSGNERYKTGIGVACGGHTNSMVHGFPDFSTMTLRMHEDGTLTLNTCVHDMGCGSLRSLQLIVAEVLDLPPDAIEVLEADTQHSPFDLGTYASRVTYICGACALKVAEAVRDQLIDTAARIWNCPKEALVVSEGNVFWNADPIDVSKKIDIDTLNNQKSRKAIPFHLEEEGKCLPFSEIVQQAIMTYHTEIIATHTHTGTTNPGAYGVHFAEVEVDTLTGLVRVLDYLAVHDVGRAINRSMVEGQIQGAVQMGIGYALLEEIPMDITGKVTVEGFKDYHLVNAPAMPEVRTLILETGGDDGPFGAKSIGEVALVPVAAAIVNAVNHALGTDLSHLPLLPEKILGALRVKTGSIQI